MIEDRETCVELNKYEDGPVFEGGNVNIKEPRQPEVTEEPKKPAREKKKPGWMKGLADRFARIMSEDEEEDDQ